MIRGGLEAGLRELVRDLVREEVERVVADLAPAPAPAADTMDTVEAAAYLKLSRSTLENKRSEGAGPPYERAGKRIVYRRSVLDAWMAAGGGRR